MFIHSSVLYCSGSRCLIWNLSWEQLEYALDGTSVNRRKLETPEETHEDSSSNPSSESNQGAVCLLLIRIISILPCTSQRADFETGLFAKKVLSQNEYSIFLSESVTRYIQIESNFYHEDRIRHTADSLNLFCLTACSSFLSNMFISLSFFSLQTK